MENAWIISSGTELTLGRTVDTNAPWLAQQLAELGIRARRFVTVGDDLDAVRDALLEAAEHADVVVLTGGLGPTSDDLTRQAMADAAGVSLELDAASLDALRAFFAQRGRDMPERNRVQAMIPRAGRALPNPCGTAPGVALNLRGTPCFALPGVPFEMKEMFTRQVAPELCAAARGQVCITRYVRTFGTPESEVGELIADLMTPGRNPDVGTSAHLGVIGIRMTAMAAGRDEATASLDQTEQVVCARLGSAVFGIDGETLATAVGGLLAGAGATVATAESCTGGLIGALITDVPGSSRYYVGGAVSYANEVKQDVLGVAAQTLSLHGAVSADVAAEMADGARRVFGTTYALSVTGIAGPDGGSAEKPVGLVYVGLATPLRTTTREFRLGEQSPRQIVRERAAGLALNLLRLELLGADQRR